MILCSVWIFHGTMLLKLKHTIGPFHSLSMCRQPSANFGTQMSSNWPREGGLCEASGGWRYHWRSVRHWFSTTYIRIVLIVAIACFNCKMLKLVRSEFIKYEWCGWHEFSGLAEAALGEGTGAKLHKLSVKDIRYVSQSPRNRGTFDSVMFSSLVWARTRIRIIRSTSRFLKKWNMSVTTWSVSSLYTWWCSWLVHNGAGRYIHNHGVWLMWPVWHLRN